MLEEGLTADGPVGFGNRNTSLHHNPDPEPWDADAIMGSALSSSPHVSKSKRFIRLRSQCDEIVCEKEESWGPHFLLEAFGSMFPRGGEPGEGACTVAVFRVVRYMYMYMCQWHSSCCVFLRICDSVKSAIYRLCSRFPKQQAVKTVPLVVNPMKWAQQGQSGMFDPMTGCLEILLCAEGS